MYPLDLLHLQDLARLQLPHSGNKDSLRDHSQPGNMNMIPKKEVTLSKDLIPPITDEDSLVEECAIWTEEAVLDDPKPLS